MGPIGRRRPLRNERINAAAHLVDGPRISPINTKHHFNKHISFDEPIPIPLSGVSAPLREASPGFKSKSSQVSSSGDAHSHNLPRAVAALPCGGHALHSTPAALASGAPGRARPVLPRARSTQRPWRPQEELQPAARRSKARGPWAIAGCWDGREVAAATHLAVQQRTCSPRPEVHQLSRLLENDAHGPPTPADPSYSLQGLRSFEAERHGHPITLPSNRSSGLGTGGSKPKLYGRDQPIFSFIGQPYLHNFVGGGGGGAILSGK